MMREHGHTNPERYTPGQAYAYCEAIARGELRARQSRLHDYRAAMASDDAFAKHLRALKKPASE